MRSAQLHVAPILPPNVKECLGNLSQAAVSYRGHQFGKDVFPSQGDFLQSYQSSRSILFMPPLKFLKTFELRLLLLFGGSGQFHCTTQGFGFITRLTESVDPDDG